MTTTIIESPNPHRTTDLWRLRAASFFQMIGIGILFPFESIWMKDNGLEEDYIGILAGVFTVLAFCGGLMWGKIADVTGKPMRIVITAYFLMSAAWVYLSFCHTWWMFLVYSIGMGLIFSMVFNVMPVIVMQVVGGKGEGRGYAFYRIYGSVGWVLGTLIIPQFVDEIHTLILIAAGAVLLAPLPLIKFKTRPPEHKHYVSIKLVLRNRKLVPVYVAVFFFAMGIPAMFRFAPIFARELARVAGLDPIGYVGFFTSINGMVAIIALPLCGLMIDRWGPRLLIYLALISMPLRNYGYGLADNPYELLLPQALHFFTWAGLEIAAIVFVNKYAQPGNKATALALYFASHVAGAMLGAVLAGYLAEEWGYPTMFNVIALLSALGLVPMLIASARGTWSGEGGHGDEIGHGAAVE